MPGEPRSLACVLDALSSRARVFCTTNPCAVHVEHRSQFQKLFTDTRTETDMIYVDDGGIMTCPGGTSAIDLAYALIEKSLRKGTGREGFNFDAGGPSPNGVSHAPSPLQPPAFMRELACGTGDCAHGAEFSPTLTVSRKSLRG